MHYLFVASMQYLYYYDEHRNEGLNLFSVNSGVRIIFSHLSSNAFRIDKSSAYHIL